MFIITLTLLSVNVLSSGQSQTYTSGGTFTAPAGVTSVIVQCWGGGGAGGGNTTNADGGGGGGGGAYSSSAITVTPGTPYAVNVGNGGTGSTGNGTNGGDTWFINSTTILAKGGTGGRSPVSGAGGVGGSGGASGSCIGTDVYSGGNGGTGRNSNTGRGGPGGSSAGTGADGTSGPLVWSTLIAGTPPAGGGIGGNGGNAGSNGSPGTIPGGGGGGSGDGNRSGGAGANGQVIISWTQPVFYSQASGDPNVLSNWRTSGGHSPSSFTASYQTFAIQNGHAMTTSGSGWTVSGTGTKVIIQNGGILTETTPVSFSANTTLQVDNGGTLNHQVNSVSIFGGTESFANSSTINYSNAGTQTVINATYGNLTLSGSGSKTISTSTVNGILSMEGTATASATLTYGTNATIQYKGSAAQVTGNEFPVTFNGTGGVIINNNAGVSLSGSKTITYSLSLASGALSIAANTLTMSNGSTLNYGSGSLTGGSTSNLTIGTGTDITLNTVTGGLNNLISNRNISLGGDLTIAGTLTLNTGSFTLGTWTLTLNGPTIAGTATNLVTSSSSGLVFGGSSAGIQIPSSVSALNTLTINNSSGITLNSNVTVAGTLTMTQGNIISGTNTLILAGSTLNYTNGTIIGKFQRAITTTGFQYLFPVGTSSNYNPLKITFSNLVPGQLAVQFLPDDIGTTGLPLDDAGNEIFDRHTTGYWRMTAVGSMASTNYNANLNYNGFTGVDAMARIIKRTNSGNLTLDGTHGSVASPEITRTAMNGISTTTTDLAIGKAAVRIVTHPSDASGCNSVFTVAASGKTPLTYRWQEDNGSGFADISDGSIYSGSATATLTITGAPMSMNGYRFRCIVTDAYSNTVTSNSAQLTLTVVTLGYSYSTDLTLDAASGSSDLNDFPALISITASPDRDRLRTVSNGGHVENSNGYDIIFTDLNGNKLDHQLEAYDPSTGQYVAWVRIPVLSSSSTTTIKMLYGNRTISSSQSVKSVWSSNYKAVWHLNGTDYTDATIYNNNGTSNATVNATGKIAGAKDFNGSTSYIITPTNGMADNDNNQTISVWGYYSTSPSGSRNFITFQNADSSSAIQLGFRGGNTVAWKWNGEELVNAGPSPSVNAWHYYVYTFDGTTSRLFVDGLQRATSTVAPQTAMPDECNIGRYNNGEYIDAVIDEPRFSMSTKTADWIMTEYNNQNNPGDFISVGVENSPSVLASVGECFTNYLLDQGYPAGGTYSGPGVSGNSFNATNAGTGTHLITYSYTDAFGCTNIVSKNIIVTPVPAAPVASDRECCYLNIVDLEATGTNIKWYTDAGLTQLAGTGTPFPTGKTTSGIYTYYVTQTINDCQSPATTVTLTIGRGIAINTQPQSVTICEGENASFSVSSIGYNLSYRWQENGVNISDGGIYSGSSTANLVLTDPGILKNGKTYQCVITTSCGPSPVTSGSATLTVIPLPLATFSYPDNPYCPNAANPLPAFSGGGIAGTFSSGPGLVFANTSTGEIDIAASTPGSYVVTNTVTAPAGCGDVTATSPFEIVSDLTWTGAISSDWNEPGNWTCNFIPNRAMSVLIPDVTNKPVLNSGATASVKNLTVNSGSSLTITDNTINISGIITNNGTISASDGTVEMSGSVAQTIDDGLFANNTIRNLTVNNTAGVTLLDSLKISGIVSLQDGNLTSGGFLTLLSTDLQTALIDGSGSGTVTGNVNMQRYLTSRFGYKYFSSPFQSATVSEFSDDMSLGTTFSMFYRYDENRASSGWVSYNTPSNTLYPLNGYAANFGSGNTPKTMDMTGAVNNGPLSLTLYNNNQPYTKGFNLVGNPYPSPIDWDASSGWTKTNIDNAIHFFRASTTDQYGGSYSSYVNGESSDGLASNIIPSMQGFFVHVSGGTFPVEGILALNNNVRINDLTEPFAKSAKGPSRPLARLTAFFSDDPLSADPLAIYFDENADITFDSQQDALKLMNTDLSVANLYALSSDGAKLSIDGLPLSLMTEYTVPLGLKINHSGNIIFRLTFTDSQLEGGGIYLSDSGTGIIQDLLGGKEYNVPLTAGEYSGRFTLNITSTPTSTEDIIPENDLFTVFYSRGILKATIKTGYGSEGVLVISNLTGNILFTKEIYESGYYEFNPGLKTGIYIVSFTSGISRISRKVFIYN